MNGILTNHLPVQAHQFTTPDSDPIPESENTMTRRIRTVTASDIAQLVDDPDHGTISLVGNEDGTALIVGEIYDSNAQPGLLVIETEHGSVYLDPAAETRIQEDDGGGLDDIEPGALFMLNDQLTSILAELGWSAQDEDEVTDLGDLVHQVAEDIDDFLAAHPQGRT